MTSSITFRPIDDADMEFLYQVYASTRTEELAQTDWNDTQKEAFLRMQFTAQHAYYQEHYLDATFLVVLVDGEPAGRLYVNRNADEIRLVDIALLPNYRNAGIGTHILTDVMAEARGSDKPLTIHVEKFNPALRLYDRLGFVPIADRGVYWLLEWNPNSE